MDPINYKLASYESIPELKSSQRSQLARKRKIALFLNFVVDYTDFQHPGYNDKLHEYFNKQINQVYHSRNHSSNADLILCHLIVGKNVEASLQDIQNGQMFYNRVKNSQINQRHQALMKKIDFHMPIIQQIQKLTPQQKETLTQTPKIFKNPQKIRFLEGKWQQFIFEQHFWVSFCVYWSYFWLMVVWVATNYQQNLIIYSLPFALVGVVVWTMVEYIFHRFILHFDVIKANRLGGHLLHHCFPNLKNKVSMDVFQTSVKLIVIAFILAYFFEAITVLMIYIGLVGSLVNYDSLHYYCHFGPEINIGWLRKLRIHHLKHHYRNQASDFGVTNIFWDSVFGTDSHKITSKI